MQIYQFVYASSCVNIYCWDQTEKYPETLNTIAVYSLLFQASLWGDEDEGSYADNHYDSAFLIDGV